MEIIFCKSQGKNPPVGSDNFEWRGVACILIWLGISGRRGVGGGYHGGRMVGERSALMGAASLILFYCPVRKKTRNGNCEWGWEGKLS